MKYILAAVLKAYRLLISPLYGNVCRYYPSCSAYALRAVEFHGALTGTWYAGRRLFRCHPWSAGGYDPVPGTPEFDAEMRDQAAAAATMESDRAVLGAADASRAAAKQATESAPAASAHHQMDREVVHAEIACGAFRSPGATTAAAQARGVN
jgi:putative membrane protein insertion efficiency factor